MARLTVYRLREVLSYDPESGRFTWRIRTSNRTRAGAEAGHICRRSGYRLIGIDGRLYKASRLAWLYMTGEWPAGLVDHRNTTCDDDRWLNLRHASQSENLQNRGPQENNTSGFKGVHFHPQSGRWRARITANNRSISLGLHDSPELAHRAYQQAAASLHGEFART